MILWSKWSKKLIPKQINFGDSTDPIIFNLVQSFTRTTRRSFNVTLGFWFVLLNQPRSQSNFEMPYFLPSSYSKEMC